MERISCARTSCSRGRVGYQIWDEMLVFTACCVVRQEDLCAVSPQAGVRRADTPQCERGCIFLEPEGCLGVPLLPVLEEQRRKLLLSLGW